MEETPDTDKWTDKDQKALDNIEGRESALADLGTSTNEVGELVMGLLDPKRTAELEKLAKTNEIVQKARHDTIATMRKDGLDITGSLAA